MLIFILQYGHPEVAELLLASPSVDENAKTTKGETALLLAAFVSYNKHIQHICIHYAKPLCKCPWLLRGSRLVLPLSATSFLESLVHIILSDYINQSLKYNHCLGNLVFSNESD